MKKFMKEEKGQALALVALAMTVLLGFTALAFDIGWKVVIKSKLQAAADAAALAAAMEIPPIKKDGTVADREVVNNRVVSVGTEFAKKNGAKEGDGYLISVRWNIYDNTDSDTVEVKRANASKVTVVLEEPATNFFARVFTDDSSQVGGRAVARRYAIWDGAVLPIVNLNETYILDDGTYNANLIFQEQWDGSPSDRDWLAIKDYMAGQGITDILDLRIDLQNGLIVDKGEIGTYTKDYFLPLLEYGGPYYIYSVSKQALQYIEQGKGIVVTDQHGTETLRFFNESTGLYDKSDTFQNKDTIVPYARLVDGKPVKCNKGDPDWYEQLVILELSNAGPTAKTGIGNMKFEGTVIKEHPIDTIFSNPEETEIGLTKARLVE